MIRDAGMQVFVGLLLSWSGASQGTPASTAYFSKVPRRQCHSYALCRTTHGSNVAY